MSDFEPVRSEVVAYSDFTLSRFAKLCISVVDRYQVLRLKDAPRAPGVIWRHDVDMSVRHALRVARIEAEIGIAATYFLLPHSNYYNLWSEDDTAAARRIHELGHDLGLHFDPTFYGPEVSERELEQRMHDERSWLEQLVGTDISSISFHQFDTVRERMPTADHVAGMVNAYGARLQSEYHYISDSNGVWRFEDLFDAVESGRYDRLQALTHPVWWSEQPMAPRRRLQACIDAAAGAMGDWYDETTRRYGRPNIW